MKYLKSFDESFFSNLFKKKYDFIEGTYTKNKDGSIDVQGNVNLHNKLNSDISLPKFNKVSGWFNCSGNNLTSLDICPVEVGGNFTCSYNRLTNLVGSPVKVGGNFCCENNNLTSLEGCPSKVGNNLTCYKNKLKDLKGCCKDIYGDFNCNKNKLTSLEGCPNIRGFLNCAKNHLYNTYGCGVIGGELSFGDNPVNDILYMEPLNQPPHYHYIQYIIPKKQLKEFIGYLEEFRPIRGKTILGKRLQECLYMCDIDIDVSTLSFKNYELLE